MVAALLGYVNRLFELGRESQHKTPMALVPSHRHPLPVLILDDGSRIVLAEEKLSFADDLTLARPPYADVVGSSRFLSSNQPTDGRRDSRTDQGHTLPPSDSAMVQ